MRVFMAYGAVDDVEGAGEFERRSKNEAATAMIDPDHVRATILSLRDERGYVLPHHGMMAAALPDLHAAYRAAYRSLTVDDHHMSPLERDCVWLAILTACDEAVGTHHVALFQRNGGDDRKAGAVFRQASWAMGADGHGFLAKSWAAQFPGFDPAVSYLEGAEALNAAVLPDATARLLRMAVHAARGNLWALGIELEAGYGAGLDEPRIAEALSLIIWPRGVNPFVRAADAWLALLRSGRVTPSPAFAAWAEASGQGPLVLPGSSTQAVPAQG
jgi:alkylhydroperoxidase/carboxymuconolactone decarboxylase family protein YurZ